MEAAGEIFVIRPSRPLEVERTKANPEGLQKAYDVGMKDALEQLDAMIKWMNK